MTKRPNILLLFTDQQRADTIAALGARGMRTPSMDRLVAEGTSFTTAYSPSPVCVPARACMHYGRYPWRTGCYTNAMPMPTDGRPSFVDLLSDAGYRTHAVGKLHFRPDPQAMRGFQTRERQEEVVDRIEDDDYLQFLRGAGWGWVRDPHGARSEMVYMPQVSPLPPEVHPSAWVADRSRAFIADQANADQPWMLMASFIHPHPPYAPPSPWDKLYRARDVAPPHLPEGYDRLQPGYCRRRLHHYYHDGPINPTIWRTIRAFYFACVSFVDRQIGRVLDTLAQTGETDDTLVIMTSDHGDMLGDYGLVGKHCMLNPAARIPLIVRRPPRFAPGALCDRPTSLVDVPTTLLGAAGIDPPDDWDGVDLADLAAGGVDRDVVFSAVGRGPTAMHLAVDGRWKYVHSAGDRREYAFDLQSDPDETRDMARSGELPADARRLREALFNAMRAGGETDALDGDRWRELPDEEIPGDLPGRNVRDNPWADYGLPG